MDSTRPFDRGARAALRAYERSRLSLAVFGFLPALLLPLVVVCVAGLSPAPVWLGAVLFVAGVVALWRGRDLARGVGPGLLAGVVPMLAALVAPHLHACGGQSCASLCVEVAAVSGSVAGVVVARLWRRAGRGWSMLGAAASIALLTGATGCVCIGTLGLFGMVVGFALGVAFAARWGVRT